MVSIRIIFRGNIFHVSSTKGYLLVMDLYYSVGQNIWYLFYSWKYSFSLGISILRSYHILSLGHIHILTRMFWISGLWVPTRHRPRRANDYLDRYLQKRNLKSWLDIKNDCGDCHHDLRTRGRGEGPHGGSCITWRDGREDGRTGQDRTQMMVGLIEGYLM